MDGDVNELGGGEEQLGGEEAQGAEQQPTREEELEKRLSRVEGEAAESKILAQLSADPDFRALLEAKQQGRQVTLVDKATQRQEPEAPKEPENLDDLTPKELVKYLVAQNRANAKQMAEEMMAPLKEQIELLRGDREATLRRTAAQQVQEAKAKFKDFDLYVNDMRELSSAAPGLSVEELYTITKRRKAGASQVLTQREVASERPSAATARPQPKREGNGAPQRGRAGFNSAVEAALHELKLPDFGYEEH